MALSPKVSVVIVNWNTRELLGRCLQSLRLACPPLEHEVIVVDNASADASAELVRAEFPDVRLIANDTNRNYAEGNNQGIEVSVGEFIWLLNPDTEVNEPSWQVLVGFMESHPRAGGVACRMRSPIPQPGDHPYQLSVRTFPTPAVLLWEALGLSKMFPQHRWFGRYRMSWWKYDDEREVEQPMASCLMLRRAALDSVGLFDPQFPLFFNDVDLCFRLRASGWPLFFTPHATILHHGGASTEQIGRSATRESHRALLAFYRKHYASQLNPIVYAGACALIRVAGWIRAKKS